MSTAEEMMNEMTEGELTDEEAGEAAGGTGPMAPQLYCQQSPNKRHRFIRDDNGDSVCKYCGRSRTEMLASGSNGRFVPIV